MNVIKTEDLTRLPSDSLIQFAGDEFNQNFPAVMNIKKETPDFDDEFHNLMNPSTLTIHQTDNSINIKTEPADIQSLQFNDTQLCTETLPSKISDVKDSVELNLNQLSKSIIKHESIDIENESHDLSQLSASIIKHESIDIKDEIYETYETSDSTPMISDLEPSLTPIKDKSCGKLENFKDSSRKKFSAKSVHIFCDICGKVFSFLGNLKRHCKEVHKKIKIIFVIYVIQNFLVKSIGCCTNKQFT